MESSQGFYIRFIEKHAVFISAWNDLIIIGGFIILVAFIYFLNVKILTFRIRLLLTIVLVTPLLILTLITFLLNSPVKSFINTLATVKKSIGDPAPGFEFISVRDSHVYHISDFKGKTIILEFWDASCNPCKDQLKELANLENLFHGKLSVIAISDNPVDSVRNFIKSHESPYLTGISPGNHWIVPGSYLPFKMIIDQKGIIREYHYGSETPRELKSGIEKYLNESP